MHDNDQPLTPRPLVHLEPLGLMCGGDSTPLRETWIDLSTPNHVLYGLNGAGKTTVLESLRNALTGKSSGGRLLCRMPFSDPNLGGRLGDALGKLLNGKDTNPYFEFARTEYLERQEATLQQEFERRVARLWLGDVPGSRFNEFDWSEMLRDLASTEVWVFTPTGLTTSQWSVSPVLLVEESSRWSNHLAELTHVLSHEDGPIASEVGLELLWRQPDGDRAPVGIVGTLLERTTLGEDWNPWWPFGQVVSDDLGDAASLTRTHLASQPRSQWGRAHGSVERGPMLEDRVRDIERRANLLLVEFLADAPVLHLALGEDADWFLGRSCSWSARRFKDDVAVDLTRLSSAEQRWASISITLALADELNASYDRLFATADRGTSVERLAFFTAEQPVDGTIEGAATTWLVLDEPERGLHRTAESQMARAIGARTLSGLRTVVATHSPDLLDHGVGEVSYVRRRTRDRPGAVISMTEFEGAREELGLNPSDMLRRTRGIALVEGEHDLRVLTGTIGAELSRLGVELLPLRGGSQLRTATESRFLFEFTDAILFPILDDLVLGPVTELWKRHTAAARVKPASAVTQELRKDLQKLVGKGSEFLQEFLSTSIADGSFQRVQPLGIPQADVLECLPVRAFVPKAKSWQDVRESARRSNSGVDMSETKFKEFLMKAHKADLSAENIERLARENPAHPDIEALLIAISGRLSG